MSWHTHFLSLSDRVMALLAPGEDALLWFQGEQSDFVRFNHGRVRQPGSVTQCELRLSLLHGQRQASRNITLGGQPQDDAARVDQTLRQLRDLVDQLPEDPHILWQTDGRSGTLVAPGEAPTATAMTDDIVASARDLDMVGVLVSGQLMAGFASSRGQRNWDQRHSFLVDWSLYQRGDKAVKSTFGGTDWRPQDFAARMHAARERLEVLSRPTHTLSPGRYRVWLEPAAVAEILSLLAWDGFGKRAEQTRTSPLLKLHSGAAAMSALVHLSEDTARGLGPAFTPQGFHKPARVSLIAQGRPADTLVSPRSAREYGVPTNGANPRETPEALDMAPGDIAERDALRRLGTGLHITNLWYLNWSDQPAGRLTGMTRFATTWVEDGQVVAPAEVMRFDDTLYHLLGDGLEGLGQRATLLPSTDTYERRSTASTRVPGALIDGMSFTL